MKFALLVGYGYGGYVLAPDSYILQLIAGTMLPLVVIILWALLLSPKAARRLDNLWHAIAKIILFYGAIILVATTGHITLAAWLAATTTLHLALAVYWKQV